jgi:hypothetical protein
MIFHFTNLFLLALHLTFLSNDQNLLLIEASTISSTARVCSPAINLHNWKPLASPFSNQNWSGEEHSWSEASGNPEALFIGEAELLAKMRSSWKKSFFGSSLVSRKKMFSL